LTVTAHHMRSLPRPAGTRKLFKDYKGSLRQILSLALRSATELQSWVGMKISSAKMNQMGQEVLVERTARQMVNVAVTCCMRVWLLPRHRPKQALTELLEPTAIPLATQELGVLHDPVGPVMGTSDGFGRC
jgi:hypothetical protein